jgi:CRP-like cAMP-binding protein
MAELLPETVLQKLGRQVPAGTVLFREGEAGHEMYVVHSGRVELTRRVGADERHVAFVPPGEFFGEMAIVNQRPRSATARVIEDAWLLVIDARTFEAMIRAKAEIAVRMIRSLAARLEQANQQIELLLLRDADHRVAACLRHLTVGRPASDEGGVWIPMSLGQLAQRVALEEDEVAEVVARLATARLLVRRTDGFVVPEVGRLVDFLEFMEMKERFR